MLRKGFLVCIVVSSFLWAASALAADASKHPLDGSWEIALDRTLNFNFPDEASAALSPDYNKAKTSLANLKLEINTATKKVSISNGAHTETGEATFEEATFRENAYVGTSKNLSTKEEQKALFVLEQDLLFMGPVDPNDKRAILVFMRAR